MGRREGRVGDFCLFVFFPHFGTTQRSPTQGVRENTLPYSLFTSRAIQQKVAALFVQFLRFVPPIPGEQNFSCGAHSIEKLRLKYSTAASRPESVSSLLWITRRPRCQQRSQGLFLQQKVVPVETVVADVFVSTWWDMFGLFLWLARAASLRGCWTPSIIHTQGSAPAWLNRSHSWGILEITLYLNN